MDLASTILLVPFSIASCTSITTITTIIAASTPNTGQPALQPSKPSRCTTVATGTTRTTNTPTTAQTTTCATIVAPTSCGSELLGVRQHVIRLRVWVLIPELRVVLNVGHLPARCFWWTLR